MSWAFLCYFRPLLPKKGGHRMLVRIIFRLQAENLALREQLAVYQRKQPKPKIKLLDRLFWLFFKRFSKAWEKCLFIVQPETVVKWHRQGFRLFRRSISKAKSKPGRPSIGQELRALIVKMATENDWGAPTLIPNFLANRPTSSIFCC